MIDEAKTAGKIAAGAPQFNVILTASQTQVKSEGSLDALVKPPESAFAALLEQLGPAGSMPDGRAMPMVIEPWPGGR